MAEATIKWLEEKQFVGIDSTDHGIVIASPGEGGKIGTKPSDLLLLALGSCTAYDVVTILQKKREKLTGLEVRVTAEQQADPPWTFQRFHIHFIVKGRGLSQKAVEDAITLSDEKYCSVSATLRLGVPVTHGYEIIGEED
jgi:putative redox protein